MYLKEKEKSECYAKVITFFIYQKATVTHFPNSTVVLNTNRSSHQHCYFLHVKFKILYVRSQSQENTDCQCLFYLVADG